ncbi:hypothetical protein IEQ34_001304 [Dendrobium chrysotoxum]|uniref:Uncharacterized protein n=1 Tax=Dendrobium chrysotoxum TaxID=161865 RepID=A0AAV7HM67_DENCH|nr:hypothetical protein IEQ34_001304 [Dendrobium chrysotoxum]
MGRGEDRISNLPVSVLKERLFCAEYKCVSRSIRMFHVIQCTVHWVMWHVQISLQTHPDTTFNNF